MSPMFKTHMLNEDGMRRAREVGESFDSLLTKLLELTVDGDPRCIAVMKTKLEEACFYAKKAIAIVPTNQQGG